jgi:hypothetical protein
MNLPVDFSAKIKTAPTTGGGYPIQLSASDLMQNFVFAALDADPSLIEATTSQGGHPARRLKIPAVPGSGTKNLTASSGALAWTDAIPTPPSSGTHVLGAVGGLLTWIATEEC